MRKYRNTVTGAEIMTDSAVSGGDWVEVSATESPAKEKKQKKDKEKATAEAETTED